MNLKNSKGLGTFYGVFLPCLLTILGVILFLRLGWVTGNLGLAETWALITLANSITFVTGLSIASIATNMKVKGGGSYYMISRSLGIEPGAAVGIPLYFAQALGAAFYVVGFAEALAPLLPQYSLPQIGAVTLVLLLLVSLASASLATKTQMLVFLMIVSSLGFLAFGGPPVGGFAPVQAAPPVSFWVAFAVFFPAVTGIEAGVALSGNLKNSKQSLPLGTVLAILCGYVVYMAVPWILVRWVPLEVLRTDPLVLNQLVASPYMIAIGIWGAALSSALNSLLAAPRTLQALARDQVVFRFLGKGSAKDDTPRLATLLSFALAMVGVWLGDLNQIAELLSMFFLTTYGLLNFAAGAEALMQNPSWRPTFKVKWWVSMAGAFGCFSVMFLLNPLATFIAMGVGVLILLWMYKRRFNRRWEDIRLGFWQFMARMVLYKMADSRPDIRTWRPNLLVFTGALTKRWHLVELGDALSAGRGMMTICAMIPESELASERADQIRKSIRSFLDKRQVSSLVTVKPASLMIVGARQMVRYYGFGPLKPNSILIGLSDDLERREDYAQFVIEAYQNKRNLILTQEQEIETDSTLLKQRIDLWWGGMNHNEGFMLALAYMMQQSQSWKGYPIRLLNIVDNQADAKTAEGRLSQMLKEARVEGQPKAIVRSPGEAPFEVIRRNSQWSEVTFLGLRPPLPQEDAAQYGAYLGQLQEQLPRSILTGLVLVAEDLPFTDLFE